MGGLFGGNSKKSSGEKKSTTAESIETADGTVYDRRGSTTAKDNAPAVTSPAPVQPMGAAAPAVQRPKMDTMETVLPSTRPTAKRQPGTLAGASYG